MLTEEYKQAIVDKIHEEMKEHKIDLTQIAIDGMGNVYGESNANSTSHNLGSFEETAGISRRIL